MSSDKIQEEGIETVKSLVILVIFLSATFTVTAMIPYEDSKDNTEKPMDKPLEEERINSPDPEIPEIDTSTACESQVIITKDLERLIEKVSRKIECKKDPCYVNDRDSYEPYSDGLVAPLANAGIDEIVWEGEPAYLDGSKSNDSDGTIVKYSWYLDMELIGNSETFFTNLTLGIHDIMLIVEDNDGLTDDDWVRVTVYEEGTKANGASLSGAVIDARTREGFDPYIVLTNGDFQISTWTDFGGNYSFIGLPAGHYEIFCEAEGYEDYYSEMDIKYDDELIHDIIMNRAVTRIELFYPMFRPEPRRVSIITVNYTFVTRRNLYLEPDVIELPILRSNSSNPPLPKVIRPTPPNLYLPPEPPSIDLYWVNRDP
ncbi:MAG: carboxypeptidase regulatory-like domain-containing protein [Thermoplasmata archaeon]|nr:MAG: carboxypeptidase regulatory-like domain-containing protein [Thermoplasmata archaeon]